MARRRDDTGASKGRREAGPDSKRAGYRELVIELDPEADIHDGDTEAEERGALPWKCQIVRIEENGELDRALAVYMKRWKARTGRNLKRAPAIRGLLRQALLMVGCIGKAPEKAKRKRVSQLALFDPFKPVRDLAETLGVNREPTGNAAAAEFAGSR